LATFTIKNIPPSLYEKLKQSAEINRRSINSEVIVCIENSVRSQKIDAKNILAKARKLRTLTQAYPISDDEITLAKEDGRQ